MSCCRPARPYECAHGHAVVPRDRGDGWVEEVAPECCPLCESGKVFQVYKRHPWVDATPATVKKEAVVAIQTVHVLLVEGQEVKVRDAVLGVFEEVRLATHVAQRLEDQSAEKAKRLSRKVAWVKDVDGKLTWPVDEKERLVLVDRPLGKNGFGTER